MEEKKYRLLKTYQTPNRIIHPGDVKTVTGWVGLFHEMQREDFEKNTDWFSPIPEEGKTYSQQELDKAVIKEIRKLNKPSFGLMAERKYPNPIYTQSQLDEAVTNAFVAARLTHPLTGMKYNTVADYLSSNIEGVVNDGGESEFALGVDTYKGNLEWGQLPSGNRVVVFKKDPKGKYLVKYEDEGRTFDQKEFEADMKNAAEYFSKVPLLCEDCGEMGKHKPTCPLSTNNPTILNEKMGEQKDWEILTCFDKKDWDTTNGYHAFTSRELIGETNCEDDKCEIRSVKRVCDGEAFSVGDRLVHNDGSYETEIVGFVPDHLGWFYFEEDKTYVRDLKNFRKLPSPDSKPIPFQWDEKLVADCYYFIRMHNDVRFTWQGVMKIIEQFKQSKQQ